MLFCKDHPRVCGEKVYHVYTEDELPGSPPRMRGKGQVVSQLVALTRITPAYAGKRFARLFPVHQ